MPRHWLSPSPRNLQISDKALPQRRSAAVSIAYRVKQSPPLALIFEQIVFAS